MLALGRVMIIPHSLMVFGDTLQYIPTINNDARITSRQPL